MKAIVTGAGGFAGGHLVPLLRAEGWTVVPLDRRSGHLARMPLRGLSADVVFHLAAFSNPAASLDAEREAFESNVAATGRLLRELRAGRFVVASSAQVYAPSRRPLGETDPVLPATPYAASKLCAEALALASGRDVVVLRPFNHTGPGQSAAYVCPRIARQVARAESGRGPARIEIAAALPRLDLFDVRDMARAYLLAADRGRRGEVYNVATGRPVSIREIARTLISMALVPLRVRAGMGAATLVTGDASKFRAATGWSPEIPLRRTLSELLDHERRREGLGPAGSAYGERFESRARASRDRAQSEGARWRASR